MGTGRGFISQLARLIRIMDGSASVLILTRHQQRRLLNGNEMKIKIIYAIATGFVLGYVVKLLEVI